MNPCVIYNCILEGDVYKPTNRHGIVFSSLDSAKEYFDAEKMQSPLLKPYYWVFFNGFAPYKFDAKDERILLVK